MKLGFIALIFFFSLTTNLNCVCCEEDVTENNEHQYNIAKLVGNTATRLRVKNIVKNWLKEDRETFIDNLEEFSDKHLKHLLLEFFKLAASDKCYQDFIYVFQSLKSGETWAIKLFDSYGKPEAGLLQGNSKWLGEYKECVNIYAPPNFYSVQGNFHGKYCNLQVKIPVSNSSLALTIGVCIPDSCDLPIQFSNFAFSTNISNKMSQTFENFDSVMNSTQITCQATTRTLTPGAIGVICLISLFIFFAVVGSSITIYEKYMDSNKKDSMNDNEDIADKVSVNGDTEEVLLVKPRKENTLPPFIGKIKPFFNCFCFLTNGGKLLDVSNTEGQLPSLHGIRFFSMCWVIICHTYMMVFGITKFPLDIIVILDQWFFQVILNGFFSVDTFFLLSGFLMAYLFFQQAAKTDGKIPWVYFYVHRYLRLTPVYMIVLAFYTTLSSYLGSGPVWVTYDTEPICQKNWWWNLLYINNFELSVNECMGWGWYLANDMQFFVISPIFLITLWRWPLVGSSLIGAFLCGNFLSNVLITYHFELPAGIANIKYDANMPNFLLKWGDYFNYIYSRPYTRIGPYLVGIILAYVLYKWQEKKYGKMKTWMLCVGWVASSSITLACVFGLYHHDLSLDAAAMYNGFSRTCYGLGVAWVIFVCVNGQGGPVNAFLSWKVWHPLSRLTYCAYLIHLLVLYAHLNSQTALLGFSHSTVVVNFLGCLVITYGAAFVTSLLFESPLIKLEKLVRSKFVS